MTLHKLWAKIRKHNKGNYRQFTFCLTLSILLISSLMLVVSSPLIQTSFPVGGDSRKQMYMISVLAVVGCTLLVFYAGKMFLRFKSREIGIFLALGTEKTRLSHALFVEVGKLTAVCAVGGIIFGSVIAFLAGKGIEFLAGASAGSKFAVTLPGYVLSLLFSFLLFLLLMAMSAAAMKRSNVIEIINEERRQEPLKKAVSKRYLIVGVISLLFGIFMAVIVPNIIAILFNRIMSGIFNIFYVFALWGLYRIMVYSLSCHSRKQNPQKYYQNLLNYGLMKFQGASVVKNMLVITLLIIGGLFAFFFLPMRNGEITETFNSYESGFSYRYPIDAPELSREDVFKLAEKHEVDIDNYREAQFINLAGSGIDREDIDEKGNIIEIYAKKYAQYECISASGYNELTGLKLSVSSGEYYTIRSATAYENVFNKFDDMDLLYCQDSKEYLPMKSAGTTNYQSLTVGNGFDTNARFVISDSDYKLLRKNLPDSAIIKQVLFDTGSDTDITAFSEAFYKDFALRSSDAMNFMIIYDPLRADRRGGGTDEYKAVFDGDNPIMEADWQYQPNMADYQKITSKFTFAILFLLFIYLAVICLTAVIVIAYTRSISVAISNRQVFTDVKKLGANQEYLRTLLKKQLQKVYVLPTILGCVGITCYMLLIFINNDGMLKSYELGTLPVLFGACAFVCLCLYAIYRVSLHRAEKILELC